MFQGESIRVSALEEGFVELCFDRKDDAINKFDKRTVSELQQAITAASAHEGLRGVLITSAKQSFIVGGYNCYLRSDGPVDLAVCARGSRRFAFI